MTLRSLEPFCRWLAATPVSGALRNVEWMVPALQTVHILAVALVATAALLISLRLLGFLGWERSDERSAEQLAKLIWRPLGVLALTGSALICAEPARALQNPIFYWKMGCLALACLATMLSLALLRNGGDPGRLTGPAEGVRWGAAFAAALWIGVIFAGRWIAYFQGS